MPGPNPADVPGKGEGVPPMRVWVPIEEQGLQKMLHAGEGRRNVPWEWPGNRKASLKAARK